MLRTEDFEAQRHASFEHRCVMHLLTVLGAGPNQRRKLREICRHESASSYNQYYFEALCRSWSIAAYIETTLMKEAKAKLKLGQLLTNFGGSAIVKEYIRMLQRLPGQLTPDDAVIALAIPFQVAVSRDQFSDAKYGRPVAGLVLHNLPCDLEGRSVLSWDPSTEHLERHQRITPGKLWLSTFETFSAVMSSHFSDTEVFADLR